MESESLFQGPRTKRKPMCRKCGNSNPTRNERYDEYACCGEWLGYPCRDCECEFCRDRPDTPPQD